MKQFVTLLIMILCSTFTANAQNYLDHLKKKEPGKGVVHKTTRLRLPHRKKKKSLKLSTNRGLIP